MFIPTKMGRRKENHLRRARVDRQSKVFRHIGRDSISVDQQRTAHGVDSVADRFRTAVRCDAAGRIASGTRDAGQRDDSTT